MDSKLEQLAPPTQWLKEYVQIGLIISFFMTVALSQFYRTIASKVLPDAEEHLVNITQQQIEKIGAYTDQQRNKLAALTQEIEIHQAFTSGARKHNERLNLFVQSYLRLNDFENVLLIQTNGNVLFSAKAPDAFAINLKSAPYNETNLGKAFTQTLQSLTSTISTFSYDFILKKPTMYMLRPVYQNGLLLGLIAAQLNHTAFHDLAQEYFELGATGEIVLSSISGNMVQIISPTRSDPHSAFQISSYLLDVPSSFIEKSVLGGAGKGVGLDYRNIMSVGSWGYIPDFAWGIVVKMNLDEVLHTTYLFQYLYCVALFITIALLCMYLFFFNSKIREWLVTSWHTYATNYIPPRTALGALLIASCVLVCLVGYSYYHTLEQQALEQTMHSAKIKLQDAAWAIGNDVERVMLRTQAIADDLSIGRLKKEDLIIRMNRELNESPFMLGLTIAYEPHMYDPQRRLFAPHVTHYHNDSSTEYIDTLYDYTKAGLQHLEGGDWYNASLNKRSGTWFPPLLEKKYNKVVVRFGVPFYAVEDQNNVTPIGVIIAEYNLDEVNTIARKLIVGETGYAFISAPDGTFIYHPNKTYVDNRETMFDVARRMVSEELKTIGTTIKTTHDGIQHYTDPTTEASIWINFDTIDHVQWKMGVVFSEQEIAIAPETVRRIFIWVVICLVMLLIALIFTIVPIDAGNQHAFSKISTMISLILVSALIVLFWGIWRTEKLSNNRGEVIISNETALQSFLVEKEQQAMKRYESLTLIPTGILLYSISFPDSEHVALSGYIWQKYDINDKTTPRKLSLPEATEISIKKEFEQTKDGVQTIVWKVTATLRQYYDHTKYPFDQRTVVIPFIPKVGESDNIFCIPDLVDYMDLQEKGFLGISRQLALSEFSIKKTYFSFNAESPTTTLGIAAPNEARNTTNMQFNVVLSRTMINALIMYIVPVLVILFSLYAIFLEASGLVLEPVEAISSLIAPYSGLLFALILLHGSLRNNYKVGGFLFIESLFFLAYITLLLFIFHALFSTRSSMRNFMDKLAVILRFFFWPLQFTCWFIVTVVVFY